MTMVIGMQGFIAFTLWLAPTPDINIVAPFVATLVSISCAAGLSALASSILQEPDLDPQAAAGRIALVIGLIILVHAPVYAIVGIMKNNEPVHDIFEALYFSIVTWTTLGYGDYSPANGVKFTAAFEALMGYVGMAVIIGLIVGRVVNEREQ